MKYLLLFLSFIVLSCEQSPKLNVKVSSDTSLKEIKGTLTNSKEQLDKPYVILVSIDGFRHDYAERYGANNLLSFDVIANKMLPSFPSKTFPNHYAIATGLYPGHNGLVSNEFYDRSLELTYSIGNRDVVENAKFYNGTPLWVLASQQKMVSASMFWVGSEAPIKGELPTYYYKYDGEINYADRVNKTIKWLQLPEEERPHFITLYFSITDDVGHKFGPNSDKIAQAVIDIDYSIGDLMEKVNKLDIPVNIIVVSDHGMLEVDREDIIYLEELLPKNLNYTSSFPAMIYSENKERIDSIYSSLVADTSRYSIFYKNDIPKRYHYNAEQDRIGNLLIMPKAPYTFGSRFKPYMVGSSTHGYDPKITPEMGAIFFAKGNAFNKEHNLTAFENIHVYPLIAHILNLKYDSTSIDGSFSVLKPILK